MKRNFTILAYAILVSLITIDLLFAQLPADNYFQIKEHYSELLQNTNSKLNGGRNNWLNRWLWLNQFAFDRNGNLNYSYIGNEFNDYSNSKLKNNSLLLKYNWTPIGPIEMPPTFDSRSCYSMGRVNCIAFHPTNKDIFWVGTPGGGIWKTVDYGQSWMPMSDQLGSLAISHIAVNPNNPDSVWAATGDFDISGFTTDNTIGVILSTDGGESWKTTSLIKEPSFGFSTLRKIIIHPQETNQLLVAGRRGIWKTTDAGNSWRKVCDSNITDIEINPKNPLILFAAMGQLYGSGTVGVLRSHDFGETWHVLETGMPPKGEISRVEIELAPTYPDYIYVLGVNSRTNGFHSLYCSTDGGNTWQLQSKLDTTNNILGAWGGDASDIYGQGSYDLAMIVDVMDKNTVYVGGINIWMSQTMGRKWEIASFWIYVFGESTHADQHWVAYNPLDKNYYWCNDGGVYRTKKMYPGDKEWINKWINKYDEDILPGAPQVKFQTKWENISSGLAITEFYRLTLSKNKEYVLAGGSQDNSCFYYNNGKWLNYIPNYDGMETMIDHDNPNIFYGVWQNGGLCKTTDGGKTVRTRLNASIPETGRWITPVSMNPNNSEHIYMGFRNLWESYNGGETWSKAIDFAILDPNSRNTSNLSITHQHSRNGQYMAVYRPSSWYQDTSQKWNRVPGELWITNDGGKNWTKSTNNLPLDSMDIVSIDYDPNNPAEMFAAFNSPSGAINLYYSSNYGQTWTDISKPLPKGIRLNMIKICEFVAGFTENWIYAGTNKGVYYTHRDSSVWIAFNNDLPLTNITDIELQVSTGEIFAASYGRGVWKTNLVSVVSARNEENNQVNLYPNPNKGKIYLELPQNQPMNEKIHISIIDVLGYEVYHKEVDYRDKIELSHNLKTGVYFILIQIGNTKLKGKITVDRF